MINHSLRIQIYLINRPLRNTNMKATKHCQLRQKQRNISSPVVALALSCGIDVKNSDKVVLKKAEVEGIYSSLLNLIKRLERS